MLEVLIKQETQRPRGRWICLEIHGRPDEEELCCFWNVRGTLPWNMNGDNDLIKLMFMDSRVLRQYHPVRGVRPKVAQGSICFHGKRAVFAAKHVNE
jgi:hypothetical protein